MSNLPEELQYEIVDGKYVKKKKKPEPAAPEAEEKKPDNESDPLRRGMFRFLKGKTPPPKSNPGY